MSDENVRLLLSVEEIRTSRTYRGWAIGPFFPKGDIRHCEAFEIKEWSISSIQRAWRRHADKGSEYIAVLAGTLTVHIGRGISGAVVDIVETIMVSAPQRLVLAPGVWRRFGGTPDVRGITVRQLSVR